MKKNRFSTAVRPGLPTIRDIARTAGVSPTTVSVVLNGRLRELRISEETAERVRQAAQKLNYRPHHSARSLRSGATRLIGLAVSWLQDPFYPEFCAAFGRACRARGYGMFLTDLPDWVESEADQGLGKSSVDGVVLVDTRRSPWHPGGKVTDPAASPVPTVMVAGEEWVAEWHLPFSDHVLLLQTEKAGRLAARHLCERGFRRFVFVPAGFPAPMTPGHRQFGFCDELHKLGVDPGAIRVAPIIRPPGTKGIAAGTARDAVAEGMVAERVVAEGQQTGDGAHDRPAYLSTRAVLESDWWEWARRERVGFYAANDVAAMEVLQALHERGIAVPGEAGVVGTNGTQLGELVVPPLTSISLDVEAIAQAAVDRLLSFIGHGDSARDSGPAASGLPGEPAACAVLAAAAAPVAVAGAAWVAEQRVLLAVQSGGEEEAKAGRDAQKLVPRLLIRGST